MKPWGLVEKSKSPGMKIEKSLINDRIRSHDYFFSHPWHLGESGNWQTEWILPAPYLEKTREREECLVGEKQPSGLGTSRLQDRKKTPVPLTTSGVTLEVHEPEGLGSWARVEPCGGKGNEQGTSPNSQSEEEQANTPKMTSWNRTTQGQRNHPRHKQRKHVRKPDYKSQTMDLKFFN